MYITYIIVITQSSGLSSQKIFTIYNNNNNDMLDMLISSCDYVTRPYLIPTWDCNNVMISPSPKNEKKNNNNDKTCTHTRNTHTHEETFQ